MKKNRIVYTLLIIASVLLLFACIDRDDNRPKNNHPGLPPDPGKAGKLTIEGIDSDEDGVRDDVQRYIALNYENETTQDILTRYAIAQQDFLLSVDDKEKAIESAKTGSEAIDCLFYLYSFDDAMTMANDLEAEVANTEERVAAVIMTSNHISGEVFQSTPDDELVNICQ